MFSLEDCKVLDSDEFGTLYSVYVPQVGQEVSVYVDLDGTEHVVTDMQGSLPQDTAGMAGYDWYAPCELSG